jgi:IS4 transposase
MPFISYLKCFNSVTSGYRVEGIDYWIATNRFDLKAEQIAQIYKLRWDIENFFAWWKRHLKVYHLIARSPYGLMVQLLAGLITYLLLAIYCHENYNEKVSIQRVRELRIMIQMKFAIRERDIFFGLTKTNGFHRCCCVLVGTFFLY